MNMYPTASISKIVLVVLLIAPAVLADVVAPQESLMCEEEFDVLSLLQTGLKLREEHAQQWPPEQAAQAMMAWKADFLRMAKWNKDLKPNRTVSSWASNFRIVVGIAVKTDAIDEREVHRATWFQSPLVCRGRFDTSEGCGILPVFLIDTASLPPPGASRDLVLQEASKNSDIMFVESSLGEKTRRFLVQGALQFPEATHFAKMDTDTYLSPVNLISDLHRQPESIYYGRMFDGAETGWHAHSPHEGAKACDTSRECCSPPSDCALTDGFSQHCWLYAQGGFWLVSADLAHGISSQILQGQPAPDKYECEDVVIGKFVQREYLKQTSALSLTVVHGNGNYKCDCLCRYEHHAFYHMYYSLMGIGYC